MATLMSCKLKLAVFVLDSRKLADAVVDASSQKNKNVYLLITIYYYFISMLFICVCHRIRLPYTTDYLQEILKTYTYMYLFNIPPSIYNIPLQHTFSIHYLYLPTAVYLIYFNTYSDNFILQYLFHIPLHPNIPQYNHQHTSSKLNIPLKYTFSLTLNVLQYTSNTSI